ncbi:serine/threonine-protein phosphatase 7 long form homolog [Salvia splendens]|uniref:serine/threonine-protein phosphatase 7 long form homolog n=1 Tax=Salvia splendens TaxID=180675 RepID=UPI001C27CA0C|nr:serine/threonine-protein phosphatase 7 long form homolog [Salvia splendens]
MGFGGMLKCGQPKDIDHHLITALIERWRPETHTFHFPIGEATVTLEDVEVLWGLKVDGEAVTGYIPSKDVGYWTQACLDFLGFIPDTVEFKEMVWKQTSLSKQLRVELNDDHDQYIYVQRARVYCLLLLGGLLIPNASGNKIPFFYLQFFMDVGRCGSYSWGGATLACLYHNLCEAALAKRSDVGRALTLLQLWAWERIPIIRPTMLNPVPIDYVPCAIAWNGPASYVKAPGHCIETFRDQFSIMHANQVETLHKIRQFLREQDMTGRPDLFTVSRMVEDGLQISGEVETMDCRPSQRSELDIDMPVRQKVKRRGKKNDGGESSSARMDTQLGDESDGDFMAPPPSRSAVRGRHSVSHTGATGEDIGLSDVHQSPPRSSVRDEFLVLI